MPITFRVVVFALAGAALQGIAIGAHADATVAPKCAHANCTADERISDQVRTALFNDSQFSGDVGINVQTRDGVVYLSGEVDTDAQRRDAEAVARRVSGVKRVEVALALRSNGGG